MVTVALGIPALAIDKRPELPPKGANFVGQLERMLALFQLLSKPHE